MSERPRARILFLAHLLPWPLEGGGQIKSYHTLQALATEYEITLLAFTRREAEETAENLISLKALCAGGVRTIRLPRSRMQDLACAMTSLGSGRSFVIQRDRVPEMHSAVREALQRGWYDAVHVDHLHMAAFLPAPNECDGVKIVLDQHNVEHSIVRQIAESPGGNPALRRFAQGEWPKLRDFERSACLRADRVLAVSRSDRAALAALDPAIGAKTTMTPIGVDLEYWHSAERSGKARDLLTIGTLYWPPNVEGIRWFHAEIWPRIRAVFPAARLNIVGARPSRAVRALGMSDPAVTVTGTVPDVRPYARTCGVFVAPLRSGSGIRVKILNALAMGLPVVSTTIGAEGIDVVDGIHLLIADTPADFADAVRCLLEDPALAARLGAAGRKRMEQLYSREAVGQVLLRVYSDLLAGAEKQ